LKVEAFNLAAIFVINSVVVKAKCSQGQNPQAKDEAKAKTLKAKAKARTLEVMPKALNPRDQGQDQGHKFLSSRIL